MVLVLARDVLLTRVIASIRLDQPRHTYNLYFSQTCIRMLQLN